MNSGAPEGWAVPACTSGTRRVKNSDFHFNLGLCVIVPGQGLPMPYVVVFCFCVQLFVLTGVCSFC